MAFVQFNTLFTDLIFFHIFVFSNHDGVLALNAEQELFGCNVGDGDGVGIVCDGGFRIIFDVFVVNVEVKLQGSL